jgi:uncharacterized damage-inducible protein DinB
MTAASAEVQTILAELEGLWAEYKEILQSVDPAALDFRPGPGFNSICAIATHVAGSQTWWMAAVLGGENAKRDRPAEFLAAGIDAQTLVEKLDESSDIVNRYADPLEIERLDETRPYRDREVTVRYILTRVLAHTALHLGHMQITRQLWELKREGDVGSQDGV